LDDELGKQFRLCFGPDAGLCVLEIPSHPTGFSFGDHEKRTLYFFSGAMLSAIRKQSQKCEFSNSFLSAMFTSFVSTNTLFGGVVAAEEEGLPGRLIHEHSKGALMFPSSSFSQQVVLLLEWAYSSLMTTENLIVYGGGLLKRESSLCAQRVPLIEALDASLEAARSLAEKEGAVFDGHPVTQKVLRFVSSNPREGCCEDCCW
jgi:hypothetical protein